MTFGGEGGAQGQGKKLSDYLGGNDKTKIVAKLQKKGGGAPDGRRAALGRGAAREASATAGPRARLRGAWAARRAPGAWADAGGLGRGAAAGGGSGREDAEGDDGLLAQEAGAVERCADSLPAVRCAPL